MQKNRVIKKIRDLQPMFFSKPLVAYQQLAEYCEDLNITRFIRIEMALLGSLIGELAEVSETDEESGKKVEKELNGIISLLENNLASEYIEGNSGNSSAGENGNITTDRHNDEEQIIFSCENLGKKIPNRFELKNLTFCLRLGQITGVIGENGNGKTTLLRLIAGEISASSGLISYPRFCKDELKWEIIKGHIGYVKQEISQLKNINTVREQIQFTAALKGLRGKENELQTAHIIQRLGLEKYQHFNWMELSGGYKLRFELARQLVWKPKLLILDEPLANLDVKTQISFLNDLRNLTDSVKFGMAVIITSQNLYDVEKIADRLIFIKNGQPEYNGYRKDVGLRNNFRCYQIDVDAENYVLWNALEGLNIIKITNDGLYKLVYVSENTPADEFLGSLSKAGIQLKYFREITTSTRMLFENEGIY